MESAVSLVYFGYNGRTLLYYCSPRLVYVLFLDSLRVSTRGGAEAKCDPQMSTIPAAAPLCSAGDPRSWLRKATPVPWAATIPPHQPQGDCVPCRCLQVRLLAGGQHCAWLSNIWELLYVVYCNYRWASPAEFGLFELLQSKLQGSAFRG